MNETTTTPLFEEELPRTPPPPKGIALLKKPIWTEQKAKLIAAYLRYFVMITRHGAYVDGFAGPQNSDDADSWSARLALNNQPQWMRQFVLCDLKAEQVARLDALRAAQPFVKGRRVAVMPGDFNTTWRAALTEARVRDKTATFCVLDQRTFECAWSTVEGIARFKSTGANKIELFYFLPIKWFDRAIAGLKDTAEVDQWWGGPEWRSFRTQSTYGRARMFSQRLETDLGYRFVRPWPIRDRAEGGHVMYFMVHATDHEEAPLLMRRAYSFATATPECAEQLEMKAIADMERRRAQVPDTSGDGDDD